MPDSEKLFDAELEKLMGTLDEFAGLDKTKIPDSPEAIDGLSAMAYAQSYLLQALARVSASIGE